MEVTYLWPPLAEQEVITPGGKSWSKCWRGAFDIL